MDRNEEGKMQQAQAPSAAHPHDPAGGDAPRKQQVAQAMERLGLAARLIADRLLEALFIAGTTAPHSAQQHVDRTARAVAQEEAAMRSHVQDLRALGRFLIGPLEDDFLPGSGKLQASTSEGTTLCGKSLVSESRTEVWKQWSEQGP